MQGATTGFEAELWQMADTLRGSMDAAEYKHVVLGLIFLKYVSDAFEERRAALDEELDQGADPEDPDEYRAQNVFWVPSEARWEELKADARQSYIGETVDEAMEAIEQANPALKDVLPKDYARPVLDKQRLGQLIDLVSNIAVGTEEARSKDVLGRVYEYFLSQFASAEGKRGGEFYTPRCVVKLLVEMLEPYQGRVYDPCCGSSGMFVQSVEFIKAHATGNGNGSSQPAGTRRDISIYGQEANYTTWRLAKMNLAIRGIEGQIAQGDAFHNDRHPDLKADFILANPPFNISDWGGDRLADDKRWQYGVPPKGNANFAWVQHMVHHLAPTGVAGFVLANGSMSSQQSGEGEIRKNLIEANLVDCMVALPGQLFYSTQIPACLWFLARDRSGTKHRNRKGEVLFIDAREMGTMVDRTHRELTDDDIIRISDTYHAWRGSSGSDAQYADEPGFCKSASLEDIQVHDHVLTPGRFVGVKPQEEDNEPFEDKMQRLTTRWREQLAESAILDAQIEDNLQRLGF
ncbi:MAG: class I SAM-dependent DNA methyltransferase [bacterium]|nr:class I SAM-dependent DNA methyltransferase [bacterium]